MVEVTKRLEWRWTPPGQPKDLMAEGHYRSLDYVMDEVTDLASQLSTFGRSRRSGSRHKTRKVRQRARSGRRTALEGVQGRPWLTIQPKPWGLPPQRLSAPRDRLRCPLGLSR